MTSGINSAINSVLSSAQSLVTKIGVLLNELIGKIKNFAKENFYCFSSSVSEEGQTSEFFPSRKVSIIGTSHFEDLKVSLIQDTSETLVTGASVTDASVTGASVTDASVTDASPVKTLQSRPVLTVTLSCVVAGVFGTLVYRHIQANSTQIEAQLGRILSPVNLKIFVDYAKNLDAKMLGGKDALLSIGESLVEKMQLGSGEITSLIKQYKPDVKSVLTKVLDYTPTTAQFEEFIRGVVDCALRSIPKPSETANYVNQLSSSVLAGAGALYCRGQAVTGQKLILTVIGTVFVGRVLVNAAMNQGTQHLGAGMSEIGGKPKGNPVTFVMLPGLKAV
jgi:hypothetical protein